MDFYTYEDLVRQEAHATLDEYHQQRGYDPRASIAKEIYRRTKVKLLKVELDNTITHPEENELFYGYGNLHTACTSEDRISAAILITEFKMRLRSTVAHVAE